MEGKISVQRGSGPTDFYFHIENSQQMSYLPDKHRSIGPRYKVNPEAPSTVPDLDRKLQQFNRNREMDQWLSSVYLGSMLLCILLERNHSGFFEKCYKELHTYIDNSEVLHKSGHDLFEIQTFTDLRFELCKLTEKYIELLRRYLSWHHEEAKKELREARLMIREHLHHQDCNEWHFISVDENYAGAHQITSTLDFDPSQNENVPEAASRRNRQLSHTTLLDIIHLIVEQEGLYYAPNKPTIKNLNNGYKSGMSHYSTFFNIVYH